MKSREFAEILGVTAGHYSDIESGKRTLTPAALSKLAAWSGTDPPSMRQKLAELAQAAEEIRDRAEESPAIAEDERMMTGRGFPVSRNHPMISNLPDPAGLARDLVAMIPREQVFALLRRFTEEGEAGDPHALRKARALMELIPMDIPPAEAHQTLKR